VRADFVVETFRLSNRQKKCASLPEGCMDFLGTVENNSRSAGPRYPAPRCSALTEAGNHADGLRFGGPGNTHLEGLGVPAHEVHRFSGFRTSDAGGGPEPNGPRIPSWLAASDNPGERLEGDLEEGVSRFDARPADDRGRKRRPASVERVEARVTPAPNSTTPIADSGRGSRARARLQRRSTRPRFGYGGQATRFRFCGLPRALDHVRSGPETGVKNRAGEWLGYADSRLSPVKVGRDDGPGPHGDADPNPETDLSGAKREDRRRCRRASEHASA